MLKEYLVVAQEALEAKKEMYLVKQQRLELAQQEMLLFHELSEDNRSIASSKCLSGQTLADCIICWGGGATPPKLLVHHTLPFHPYAVSPPDSCQPHGVRGASSESEKAWRDDTGSQPFLQSCALKKTLR